ncbi:hypothetical protein BJP27_06960 [Pseudomonas oryzihabitans]|nr:hypothetical protein BJP27_06960 [Pseudomonas psychrotolerans]
MDEQKLLEIAVSSFVKEITKDIKSFCKGISDEAKNLLETGIDNYIQLQYERFKQVKTILRGNTPNYFYDVYYPLNIKNPKHLAVTSSISNTFEKSNYVTVIGDAGSGKSTLVKHLFLRALSEKNIIPIFIELRNLPNEKGSIEAHVKEKIIDSNISDNHRILDRMLANGKFLFFLDGYDEVTGDSKKTIVESLNNFVEKHSKNKYLLTTRPYSDIDLLPLFHNYKIEQLEKDDIDKFIEKQLREEPELADKIKKSIKEAKARYINSFLKNPLLLSLYILTYQSNASIPTKKYVFYRRVINALFSEHDSKSKLGFERETRCKLQQEEFERILKSFCFVSYFEESFTFQHDQLVSKLELIKAKNSALKFSSTDFIIDMKTAVSLWTEDGGVISFAHRSLQEYFAALFIKDLNDSNKEKVYEKIRDYSESMTVTTEIENFLSLCEEMDEIHFNQHYALPTLEELKKQISGRLQLNKFLDFFTTGMSIMVGTAKDIYPSVNKNIYKSVYFHLPYTIRLHQMLTKIPLNSLHPEIPTNLSTDKFHVYYFKKTKGLKKKVIDHIKLSGGDRLASKFSAHVNKEIERRTALVESQTKSNNDLVDMI